MGAALLATVCVGGCRPSPYARVPAPIASATPAVPNDGNAWLQRMRHRYSTCRSYRDMGILRSKLYHAGESKTSRQATTFRTTFDRASSGFYFEWIDVSDRFFVPNRAAIWRETPGLARQWFSAKRTEVRDADLSDALGAFAGISGGLTSLVPRFLLDDCCDCWKPGRKVGAGPEIEGARTVELTLDAGDTNTRVWLRESDAALVRLADREVLPPLSSADLPPDLRDVVPIKQDETPLVSERMIDFYPVFDEPAASWEFRFSPPVAAPLEKAPDAR
jgi:hypothetical protein